MGYEKTIIIWTYIAFSFIASESAVWERCKDETERDFQESLASKRYEGEQLSREMWRNGFYLQSTSWIYNEQDKPAGMKEGMWNGRELTDRASR